MFLILIAVALFAALSYAVTSSGRGGGGISQERAALISAQMAQFLSSLSVGITRMNVRGTSQQDIVFHGGTQCASDWITCDSGEDCLFAPEGGDVEFIKPPAEAFAGTAYGMGYPGEPATEGSTQFWIECDADLYDWGVGTSAGDRGFYYMNVDQEVCKAFNRGVNIEGIPGEGGVLTPAGAQQFCGYSSANGFYQINYLLQAF